MRVAIASFLPIFLACLLVAACSERRDESEAYEIPASADARAMAHLLAGDDAGRELVSTASGLHYVDLVEGEGDPPRVGQICSTHATLELLDGTLIWNSRTPDAEGKVRPFEFRLGRGGVIPGWEEGVASMKPGGRRILAVPPELGYGETGTGAIPPDATLIFSIDLLDVHD